MLVDNNSNKTNIWQDILREAMSNRDLEESNVFVFGDKFVGKRSLIKIINKELLQKGEVDEHKKFLGSDDAFSKYGLLDYTYLNIKKISEIDAESIGKIKIWISNDMITAKFFESIIKPEYILKSVCIIVLDLSRPFEMMENLKRWTNFIYETFSALILKFPFEKQQELRNSLTEYLKLYEEPQFDDEGNFKKDQLSEENINLKLQLPLKDGILKTNIGVPLVIVVNKSDVVLQTGERKRFEEDSEFILKHLRNFTLAYGGSIIYTSTKQNSNLNVLYEYLLHRLYKFDLRHRPNLMDRDSYFVPAGYDSLSILRSFDIQNELQLLYEDRVPYVKPKNVIKEEEVQCEDLNLFLKRFVEKSKKLDVTSRRNISADYTTEENKPNSYSTEERGSVSNSKTTTEKDKESLTVDIKENFTSNGKPVNFEIFNQKIRSSENNTSSYVRPTAADRLEAIKRNNERLLINNERNVERTERDEKYEKTRENVMKKLNQLRKDK